MTMLDYTIWTDGGCLSNPNGKGGYGVVIQNNNDGSVQTFSKGFVSSTNNRMEVRAIIRALEEIPDGSSAVIYSDSKYAVNTFNGEYRKKKNTDLWEIADRLISKKGNIIFSWVKGHADNENNNKCDELATEAMHSIQLDVDTGFVEIPVSDDSVKQPVLSNNNAMSVEILPMIPNAFVNDACIKQINLINQKDKPTFKDYLDLKVGGRDFWSDKKIDFFKSYFGEYLVFYVLSYFSDEQDGLSALRWYGRGLILERAIRKKLVDLEIGSHSPQKE